MSKQRFLLKLGLFLGQGRSPRPPRTFAAGDGAVGLGIVAAMGALSRSQPMPISAVVTRMKKTVYYGNGGVLFEPLLPALERAEPPVAVEEVLRCCFLCQTKLDGVDAYMYREKAFCSEGCRHQQLLLDELVEKLGHPSAPPCYASALVLQQLNYTN